MKTVTFLGPTHALKVDGKTIARGEDVVVPDDIAARLKKDPRIEVKVTDAPASQADKPASASTQPRAATPSSPNGGGNKEE